jgi:hypothetical protein
LPFDSWHNGAKVSAAIGIMRKRARQAAGALDTRSARQVLFTTIARDWLFHFSDLGRVVGSFAWGLHGDLFD